MPKTTSFNRLLTYIGIGGIDRGLTELQEALAQPDQEKILAVATSLRASSLLLASQLDEIAHGRYVALPELPLTAEDLDIRIHSVGEFCRSVLDDILNLPKLPPTILNDACEMITPIIEYVDRIAVDAYVLELKEQNAKLSLSADIRLAALKELPRQELAGKETDLDFSAVVQKLEKIAQLTSTQLFDPPEDYLRVESLAEAVQGIRSSVSSLEELLLISETVNPESFVRTSLAYGIAYCRKGQEFASLEAGTIPLGV